MVTPMFLHRRQSSFPRRAAQQGVVLLVALIFLILLTLIAIGASSGSLLQQRMVSATRNAQLATISADTALRGAEWQLWSITSSVGGHLTCLAGSINAADGCVRYDPTSPLYAVGGDVTAFRSDNNKWLSLTGPISYMGASGSGFTSTSVAADTASPNVAQNPQYIIEDMGRSLPPGAGPQHEAGDTGPMNGGSGHVDIHIYRITARATGGNDNTVRVVESTFDAQASN